MLNNNITWIFFFFEYLTISYLDRVQIHGGYVTHNQYTHTAGLFLLSLVMEGWSWRVSRSFTVIFCRLLASSVWWAKTPTVSTIINVTVSVKLEKFSLWWWDTVSFFFFYSCLYFLNIKITVSHICLKLVFYERGEWDDLNEDKVMKIQANLWNLVWNPSIW